MLPEMQKEFLDHVFDRGGAITSVVAEAGAFSAEQRLSVYRNNTWLTLCDALLQAFPAVTKLVDERFMRYAAHEFIKAHVPVSGDMNEYGSDFPSFLKTFPAMQGHPYVTDVAALEWARQESYLSPVNPAPQGAERFRLQPHVRLLSSAWPVVDIWDFALRGGTAPAMAEGTYFALACRSGNGVEVWRLSAEAFADLDRLSKTGDAAGINPADFHATGIFEGVPL